MTTAWTPPFTITVTPRSVDPDPVEAPAHPQPAIRAQRNPAYAGGVAA